MQVGAGLPHARWAARPTNPHQTHIQVPHNEAGFCGIGAGPGGSRISDGRCVAANPHTGLHDAPPRLRSPASRPPTLSSTLHPPVADLPLSAILAGANSSAAAAAIPPPSSSVSAAVE
ncbi:hypothetical protein ACP70R_019010 [Stipagrostis hirtigluma subsp. patula]